MRCSAAQQPHTPHATSQLTLVNTTHSHSSSLSALLFSRAHPSLLLSASLSSSLAFHDTSSRQLVQRIDTGAGGVTAADWSEDGNYIAVGLGGGDVELYDVRREGERVARWRAHDGEVRSVRWQRSRSGGAQRAKDTPASVETRGRGGSTPLTVDAPSASKRAAMSGDDASLLGDESDGSYAPITPYVAHTKSALSSAASNKPHPTTSFSSTLPPPTAFTSASAMSLPAKVRAARAAAHAAAPASAAERDTITAHGPH